MKYGKPYNTVLSKTITFDCVDETSVVISPGEISCSVLLSDLG